MMNTKADLALYLGQDLTTAGQLTLTEVNALFESDSYQNHKKNKENQSKTMSSIMGGINNVIKGLNNLGSALSSRRRK